MRKHSQRGLHEGFFRPVLILPVLKIKHFSHPMHLMHGHYA